MRGYYKFGLIFVGLICPPPVLGQILITEIMYNPAGTDVDAAAGINREWVELYNAGASTINLSGWQLGDSQDNTFAAAFPAGTMLSPQQTLVVTGSASTFDAQWGTGIPRIQVANFPSLANDPSPTNETVAIRDNLGVIRDEVNYDDANGWTVLDGSIGASIFATPAGLSSSTNDVGTNWKPSMWGVYGGRYRASGGSNHASPGIVSSVAQTPFAPSPDAAWSMVVVPDTQNYVKSATHVGKLNGMMQWIVNNKDEFKVQVVLQEGDIVNQNSQVTPTSGDQTAAQQWANARNAFSILNGQVPYIMAVGNHDLGTTSAQNRDTQFNTYFKATDNPLNDPAAGGILQGTMAPDDLENAYYQLQAPDGRQLLIFSLEFGPRQAVVDWAQTIAARPEYADHTAVLLTHAYMNQDETRYDWTTSQDGGNPHAYPVASDVNDGQELWDELVKLNGNFRMTLNGHVGGDGVAYLASTAAEGNTVHQMLFNTQFETNGGNGWLRVLEFLNDGVTVRVRTYSPYHDLYRTDSANSFTFRLGDYPPGDYSQNGVVDAADFSVWRDSLGGTDLTADGNSDGVVSIRDLWFWQEHFGRSAATISTTAIPESASGALLAVALFPLLMSRLSSRVQFRP